jgi:hypothetical protein
MAYMQHAKGLAVNPLRVALLFLEDGSCVETSRVVFFCLCLHRLIFSYDEALQKLLLSISKAEQPKVAFVFGSPCASR